MPTERVLGAAPSIHPLPPKAMTDMSCDRSRLLLAYGLTRDELRYVLDPKEVMGADYPSETFRVLEDKELREFGEYRTRRLVLEAWGE